MRNAWLFAASAIAAFTAYAGDERVQVCYAVADGTTPGLNHSDAPDRLMRLRPNGSGLSLVGETGTRSMEAIALNRAQNRLYAVDNATFGTIDTETGLFTEIGEAQRCQSPNGVVVLNDLDALAWDPATGEFWAVEREGRPRTSVEQTGEFLVQIDPSTGLAADGTCIELTGEAPFFDEETDVDAITFAPDGRVLATANSGSGRRSRLVSIDVSTGVMTEIGPTLIDDIEGLHYDERDNLLGTTGLKTSDPNSLVAVNDQTGAAQLIGDSGLLEIALKDGSVTADVEAISCRLESPEIIENPSIDIEKATNGQDADLPPGPTVEVGDTVIWTYVVTNDGDVDLLDLIVSDNQEGTICSIAALAVGASETCSQTGTAVEGQYANVASVVGNTEAGQSLTDADPSHYFADVNVDPGNPAVDIEKATNGEDADVAPGPTVETGDTVTWTYVVTNTGDVGLINLVVTDDLEGEICTLTELAPSASANCSKSGIAEVGQYENIATVNGQTEGGAVVTDSDPSHYVGETVVLPGNPDIDVEKATNGVDADEKPGPQVEPGEPVTWTYVVTNTGDETLLNINVTDDLEGRVCTIETLAVGASQQCELSGTAGIGQYENMARAEGTGSSGGMVDDEDPSHYIGVILIGPGSPAIDLEKYTNGLDADIGPGPRVEIGSTVQWTYVVTNVGDLPLTDVTITDDIEGPICVIRDLPINTQRQCNVRGSAIGGEYENMGSVTARASNGATVTDIDPSHYIAAILTSGDPAIDIEKYTNGVNADQAPGPVLEPGDDVVWSYIVTNTGDAVLVNVQVSDDREGGVCVIPQMSPGEAVTCRLTGVVQPRPYANIGTATGRDGRGQVVSDIDPSHYTVPVSVSGPLPPGSGAIPAPVDARWALILLTLLTLALARPALRQRQ